MYRLFPLILALVLGVSFGIFPESCENSTVNLAFNMGVEAPLTPYTPSMLHFNPKTLTVLIHHHSDSGVVQKKIDFYERSFDLYKLKLPLLFYIDSRFYDFDPSGSDQALCNGAILEKLVPSSIDKKFTISMSFLLPSTPSTFNQEQSYKAPKTKTFVINCEDL